MSIKAIIFDNFGVLVTSHWQEFWGSLPTTEQQEKARELNRAFDGGLISKEDFLEEITSTTGRSPDEVEEVLFGGDRVKNVELLHYISQALKPKYKIGLLSNISSNWILDEFLTPAEQKLFDDFVFSYQVKMTKPDPEIFKLACERLGVTTNEAVLVDDIERYCIIAKELGMKTVLYKDFISMKERLEKALANPNN